MANGSDDIQRVLEATDLVRLIGEQLPLKRKGREWACVCPFHDDHAPSMFVSPTKQIYKCFACGAGGDALSFVKNYFKMDFREALQYLADRHGVKLTPWTPPSRQRLVTATGELAPEDVEVSSVSKDDLARANLAAAEFFRVILNHPEHGRVGRELLASRGVSPEMITRFGLGLAPDRWDGLLTLIGKKGWDAQAFLAAGLLKTRETGGHYDGFRHRVMYPITDMASRTIGFGARKIRPEDEPKYLNSPESALFNKSATLYALPQASEAIRKAGFSVVVEGYMDAIACHQAGVCNVVATLGTALTRQGARVLERFASRVILMFDGDNAGQRAADRAIEVLFESSLDVRIATLAGFTDAKDPDELLKRDGGGEVLARVFAQATDALAYRFTRLRQRLAPLGVQQKATEIEAELARMAELGLGRITPVRKDMIIRQIATLAGIDERTVRTALANSQTRAMRGREGDLPPDESSENRFAALRPQSDREYALIAAICEPALLSRLTPEELQELGPSRMEREPFKRAAEALDGALAAAGRSGGVTIHAVTSRIEPGALASVIAGLAAEADHTHDGDSERLLITLQAKIRSAINDAIKSVASTAPDAMTRLEALRRAHGTPGWKPLSVPRADGGSSAAPPSSAPRGG